MRRFILEDLKRWKGSTDRKPLILQGARQVGKTWILKEFGRLEYENCAYINCERDAEAKKLFWDFDTDRIIKSLSALSGVRIEPRKTLVILDEIQSVPNAMACLKYFCEEKRDYDVAAAGSLLGLNIHEGTGFPVGKVDFLNIFPMSFMEFLLASGKEQLFELILSHDWKSVSLLDNLCRGLLGEYFFTGGMPEVVESYVNGKDIFCARKIQKRIIGDYSLDFSKHISGLSLAKVKSVWNSIPVQLARENKRFTYGLVRKNSRGRDYEEAIQWLLNAGLVHMVGKTKKIGKPLKFFADEFSFKLYLVDLGLLGAMVEAEPKDYLVFGTAFEMYKGAFAEQFVAQQYFASCMADDVQSLFYYTNDSSSSEIDFVFQKGDVFPVEVKGGKNLYSKSLSSFLKTSPQLHGLRFSMLPYEERGNVVNVPLYLAEEYMRWLTSRSSGDKPPLRLASLAATEKVSR